MQTATSAPLGPSVTAEVRAEMGRQGLSIAGLARRIGRADRWVSRRISGAIGATLDDLAVMAGGLNLTASELIQRAEGRGHLPDRAASVTAESLRPVPEFVSVPGDGDDDPAVVAERQRVAREDYR